VYRILWGVPHDQEAAVPVFGHPVESTVDEEFGDDYHVPGVGSDIDYAWGDISR
jgi:hypothetical protein